MYKELMKNKTKLYKIYINFYYKLVKYLMIFKRNGPQWVNNMNYKRQNYLIVMIKLSKN